MERSRLQFLAPITLQFQRSSGEARAIDASCDFRFLKMTQFSIKLARVS